MLIRAWRLNVKTIIVSKMISHCAGTVKMKEKSERGIRKWEEVWLKTRAEDGETGAAVTCDGRLFHRRAAATGNVLSPMRGLRSVKRINEYMMTMMMMMMMMMIWWYCHQADDVVTLIPWVLPSVAAQSIWYNGQLLAVNDCLYRTSHAFQYVAFNDVDEFIVPHSAADWSLMIAQLTKTLDHRRQRDAGDGRQSHRHRSVSMRDVSNSTAATSLSFRLCYWTLC